MALPTTNIKISDVQGALGVTDNDLGALCTHPNVNQFSFEKPGTLVVDFGTNTYSYQPPAGGASDPYKLGDFRGYAHNADGPYLGNNPNVNVEVPHEDPQNSSYTFSVAYFMPNYDINSFLDTGTTLTHFYLRAFEGATLVDENYGTAIVQGATTIVTVDLPYDFPTGSETRNYTIEAGLSNSTRSQWLELPTKLHNEISITMTYEYYPTMTVDWNSFTFNPSGNWTGNWSDYALDDENINVTDDGTTYTFTADLYILENGVRVPGDIGFRDIHINNNAGQLLFYETTSISTNGTNPAPLSVDVPMADLQGEEDIFVEIKGVSID